MLPIKKMIVLWLSGMLLVTAFTTNISAQTFHGPAHGNYFSGPSINRRFLGWLALLGGGSLVATGLAKHNKSASIAGAILIPVGIWGIKSKIADEDTFHSTDSQHTIYNLYNFKEDMLKIYNTQQGDRNAAQDLIQKHPDFYKSYLLLLEMFAGEEKNFIAWYKSLGELSP